MNDDDRGIIPTHVIADCSDYVDKLIDTIREAGVKGRAIPVEQLTMIQLYAQQPIGDEEPTPAESIIHQQALMLAVCLQRLALR